MDRISKARNSGLLALAALVLCMPFELAAQVPIDEYGQPLPALDPADVEPLDGGQGETLSDAELEELVGPVALYPDDLLAIVLPASTYPLEIVQAARFLDELAKDSSLEPDESWDESVVALLNYPEVVYMMDQEIDWTWRLGEAVIMQQADVLAAVESFRERAYAAGNLESDDRQTVSNDDGVIEIEPVDDEIIYVPYYEPEEVIVYQPRRVYHYYPYAYPVYYYPYPVGYSFASGYFWGVTTAFTIGWHSHYLHVHHPSYWGHPYYGRHYYGHYYRRPSISVFNYWYVNSSYRTSPHRYRDGDYWRPRVRHSGARPATQTVRNYHYSGRDARSGRSDRRDRSTTRNRQSTQIAATNETRTRQPRTATRETNRGARVATDNRRTQRAARGNPRQRNSAGGSTSRQGLAAQDARHTTDTAVNQRSTRQSRNATRPPSRQQVARQATTRRTATRPATRRQTTPQRTATRAAATQRQTTTQRPAATQRQATTQRTATRPAATQRQATPQRTATRPATQRRASHSVAQRPAASRNSARPTRSGQQVQRAAAPSNRGSGRSRQRHQNRKND